jgi:N-methylhydantoinase A
MEKYCRIGVDVGGTFTDCVLANMRSGKLTYYKEPSIPDDPSAAVIKGLVSLIALAGEKAGSVELVMHGTTLALNSIIEKRGARVGMVISKGFGDTMELGRGGLPNSYNYKHPKQKALIARNMVLEINARTRPDGTVILRPDKAEIEQLAVRLEALGVQAVAIVLLNSYTDATLEDEVTAELTKLLPNILITQSSRLWPEIREYERALVTALNSYIHPLMNAYYKRLGKRLKEAGIEAPLYITSSNGGTVSVDSAGDRPIETLLSGPASGVVAAAKVASRTARKKVITLDMGGTSSDIAISTDGEPEITTETKIGDYPLILPVVNVWTIGAGGGSIVWVDPQGVIKVGPESAGADPGPVCYGHGGTRPTLTDCYVQAGYIDADHFLGGRMRLDRQAAEKALERIAIDMGIEGPEPATLAADAALRVATVKMATEISKGMAQRGLDPSEFALIPYGGAGPTHVNLLAEEAGLKTIIVPPGPGTFCACGAIMSDIKRDFIRSRRLTLGVDADAPETLAHDIGDLAREADQWISLEGTLIGEPVMSVACDMQYPRTAYELNIPIAESVWQSGDSAAIAELFHERHEVLYGFRDAKSPVDITTIRMRVVGSIPPIEFPKLNKGSGQLQPVGERRLYRNGSWITAVVYNTAAICPGVHIPGPAAIELTDSTVWVFNGWSAAIDEIGVISITRTGD